MESVKSINKSASSSGHTTEQKPVYDFFKLDELPQLFNILKGDISIVGLRPVMEVETEIYGNYRDMLLSVKPGLTGFRAANGRSCTSYARRRAMEICYIKNRSVCFDLKIILKTITSVFKGEGAV
nr:sugar transferase [Ruminococcus bromii]